VISVPRTVADNLDQSDDSSGQAQIDYSEKRSLPISIPDYRTVQHTSERYVVCINFCSLSRADFTIVLLSLSFGRTVYFVATNNENVRVCLFITLSVYCVVFSFIR